MSKLMTYGGFLALVLIAVAIVLMLGTQSPKKAGLAGSTASPIVPAVSKP